ncbi:AsmA family protein [Oceanibaculum indicum]|uniref:AsmA family protein n=1 Tax=Oceanibaculum indicum P24 TaxID=1207063 RepID=K2JUR3_9PROT|nr:AsmA family protein [Oceanibaculum indicum]EKE68970.1 AsmA family protein [Oceanibaculum indicum P24]
MRLKTIAKIVGVLLIALVVAVVVVVKSIDSEDVKRQIAEQVSASTGRTLAIAGDLDVGISLTPVLAATSVTFSNAEWGSRPEMARIGELQVSVALLPLISGQVDIRELVVRDADILLETNRQGRGNWQFGEAKPAGQNGTQSGGGADIAFRDLTIERSVLVLKDAATGTEQKLTVNRLALEPSGNLNKLDLDIQYQEMAAALSGTVGSIDALTTGRAVPIDLEGSALGIDLALSGTAAASANGPFNLSLSASGKDFAGLKPVAGDLPQLGAFDLKAQVSGDGKALKLEPLSLKLGRTDLAGGLSVKLGGTRPALTGSLASDALDLAPFIGGEDAPAAGTSPAAGSDDGRVIPDDPLPLDALKSFDATLDYKAAKVLLKNGEMTDLSAKLSLANGDLNLKPLVLTAFGGKIEQNLRLNAAGQTPQLTVEGKVEKLDMGALLKAAADSDMLTANTDASWQLSGRGASPRAIAASLDGQIRNILQDGTVNSKYFELIAADLVPKLLPGNTAQEANLNCIVTRIDIAKGVATNRVMLMDTSRVTIVGTGTANLGTEQLDMKLTPSPKDKSLISLATPILISGSFANPSFSPDPVALATGVAGAVAGTMVNPLGLLVPFLSSGSGESPCAQAIANLDNPDAGKSGSSGGTQQQDQQQQPGSIPGLFKNLLGR